MKRPQMLREARRRRRFKSGFLALKRNERPKSELRRSASAIHSDVYWTEVRHGLAIVGGLALLLFLARPVITF